MTHRGISKPEQDAARPRRPRAERWTDVSGPSIEATAHSVPAAAALPRSPSVGCIPPSTASSMLSLQRLSGGRVELGFLRPRPVGDATASQIGAGSALAPITWPTSGGAPVVVQRQKYDGEIRQWNGKNKQGEIAEADRAVYRQLREKGFGPPEGITASESGEYSGTIQPAGSGGQGADFIASRGEVLWIVEAKGSGVNWTSKRNVELDSGAHVPAKQLAHTVSAKHKPILSYLRKTPLSERLASSNLLLAVTNLGASCPMMAIIVDESDKGEPRIIHQHPVLLSQIVNFVKEQYPKGYETLEEQLFGEVDDTLSEAVGASLQGNDYNEDDAQQAFDLNGSYVGQLTWAQHLSGDEKDTNRKAFDYLEVAYNFARRSCPHNVGGGGDNAADATQSLTAIKTKGQHWEYRLHIYLQPVHGSLP